MKHILNYQLFEAKKANAKKSNTKKQEKLTHGTKAKLFINDDSKTIDVIDDFEFESTTLAGIKKELVKMSRELMKEYRAQADKDEDNSWWYQGEFTLNSKKYLIEGTDIDEDEDED